METIKRDLYLNQLIDRKENGLVKVITGVRRCGKSYLLFNIFYNHLIENGVNKDNIITLALDSDENREYRKPDNLSNYLHSKITNNNETFYILLDEVQYAISDEELKSSEPIRLYGILNSLLRLNNIDIYITGSNSKFLSSDIMTEFRGRGDEVYVQPLSFAEFYSAYKDGDKQDAWDEYSTYGGLPMILTKKTDREKAKYLTDLLTKTYIKDIVERNHLHGDFVIDNLVDILASSIGSLTNPTKLAKTFVSNGIKTSDNTLSKYIEFLIDAFMISKAKRYNIKGKKYINSPAKYYFTDIGIRNCRLNFRQQEQTHIMENVIYNELIARGFNVDVGIVECVVKDENGKQQQKLLEVDFVCNMGNKRYYIQSAFSIPDSVKMNQECSSLDKISDSFKKIIVTQDRGKPWINEKGYVVMNILDFLLNPNSLDF